MLHSLSRALDLIYTCIIKLYLLVKQKHTFKCGPNKERMQNKTCKACFSLADGPAEDLQPVTLSHKLGSEDLQRVTVLWVTNSPTVNAHEVI